MVKKILFTFIALIFTVSTAFAELSSNPWLEENDEEDLKEVYAKQQKRNRNNMAGYTSEDETIVDRSHAYIELPDQTESKKDEGFFDKISSSFSKKEEAPLVSKASLKHREQQQQIVEPSSTDTNSSSGFMPDLGIDKGIKKVKNALKIPSTTSMIQKFERASGINLKSIGKQLRR